MKVQNNIMHGTTVLCVKRDGKIAIGGDGQVTMGSTIVKAKAKKVREIIPGRVLAGFSGATADALTLFERLEGKLKEYNNNLPRACVELAKEWRMDKALRRLEALLIAIDKDHMFLISGNGDVIEPDENVIAIGSGAMAALGAAIALLNNTGMSAREIVVESLKIASNICIYTNDNFTIEEL